MNDNFKTWKTVEVGDCASKTQTITSDMVDQFAKLTGDDNPIHLDEQYAKKTVFRKRVVHGVFQISLISALLATEMPGRGSIYHSQNTLFTAALFVGESVTARVEVIERLEATKQIRLKTTCMNDQNQLTMDGTAIVYPARR
ncbi:MAG: enoyl-CoA hydratase [Planctomycetota bacterium]|nr:MAG: enoyl-CoA hydratase [Planctomycetota bacterium]